MSLSNVIRLRPVTVELYRGQSVEFPDPDLPIRNGLQIMNEGTIAGFPEDDQEIVLVIIKGEPGAARRIPKLGVTPATP